MRYTKNKRPVLEKLEDIRLGSVVQRKVDGPFYIVTDLRSKADNAFEYELREGNITRSNIVCINLESGATHCFSRTVLFEVVERP